ncbi:uncharacterized protein LOC133501694 [Syngnathoides biaculeatus]|uniref:uncharacterized protein LOC133501694 n=1 Tax=Syngnathoides biaculeatus TaxID=300417 RepID=UPI002ADD5E8F|nr:uncharacterized protein LOC133501694 [Syngnathoides biaculeatus]
MIKRCSATLFLALVLLWCFTGTKVEAWKPLSGQDLPDPPYHHPFDPLRPPNQNPLPKPSTPKPPTGPSLPKPNNPSHPGPPYTPDHVFPPYIPVGSNFQFQNPPNPHVSPPWPFLPSPQTQNPPPLQKPPSGNQQNPLATGPYFVLKPPYNSLSHNPKYSQLPPWKYALLSQLPVDSPSEKPPDLVVHPPFYGPYLPSPYKPTVPVSPDPDSKPPNSKPPKDQQRVPFLYYDLLPPLQNPLLPGTPVVPVPQEPTDVKPFNQKEMDQLQKTPSFPGPPVGPVYQMPSYPSFSPKPVDQQHQNPSLPRRPPKNQQPGGLIQQLNNPSLVGPPWFSGLRQKPVDQSDQKPVQQQQIGTVNSGSNNPSFPQLPLGPPYFATKGKKPLPRGFSLDYSSQEPQSNHPGKHTPVQSTPVAKDPNLQTCDVLPVQRIPCGGSDISAAACEAISCCYDGQQCYFGKSGVYFFFHFFYLF